MAERYREYKEYCWPCKLANMSAELGRVKMAQEKKAIERRIQKEGENQEWKRKMWKVIQKAREEHNARLYRKLTKVIELNSTCASYGKVVNASERSLPGDGTGIDEQKQGSHKHIEVFSSF